MVGCGGTRKSFMEYTVNIQQQINIEASEGLMHSSLAGGPLLTGIWLTRKSYLSDLRQTCAKKKKQ